MYSPRPPAPIAAAIVAVPTPMTAATRMPATIDGSASGSSTCQSSCRGVMPSAVPASTSDAVDAAQPGDRRPHDRQQRVENQRDERRRARRGRRRTAAAAGSRTAPGSESSGRRWRATTIGAPSARPPRGEDADRARRSRSRRPSRRRPARRAAAAAPSSSARCDGQNSNSVMTCSARRLEQRLEQRPDARIAASARARAARRSATMPPSSSTPTRSPSANASAMSCVTMTTVFRTLRLDAAELAVQLRARDRIERAERLVHQQDRRIGGQRARDADALPLAARQLERPARARRSPAAGRPARAARAIARVDARRVPAQQPRHDADVLRDGHVRKQPDLLEDVADAAAQLEADPTRACRAPRRRTAPRSGTSRPLTSFRSVLLPAPLRPTSATVSPASMSRSRPRKTLPAAPRDTWTPRSEIAGAGRATPFISATVSQAVRYLIHPRRRQRTWQIRTRRPGRRTWRRPKAIASRNRRYDESGEAGISNRPLGDEVERQKEVPARGDAKRGAQAG